MKATIEKSISELRILTPYSAPFVAALKAAIPYTDRAWSKPAWIVTIKHLGVVLALCQTHFGGADVKIVDEKAKSALAGNGDVGQVILVEYLGACKEREGGRGSTAFGWWQGGWNVIFREEVLRGYFKTETTSQGTDQGEANHSSLYQILAESRNANFDQIRSAYRRLARIWHPDINHEEDAQERFIAIKRAYDVLGDPQMRKKYDAGLALEASLTKPRSREVEPVYQSKFYRAPLTCGKIEVTGTTRLGKLYVDSILTWFDVVNMQGKTMVSSWNKAEETFKVEWVI